MTKRKGRTLEVAEVKEKPSPAIPSLPEIFEGVDELAAMLALAPAVTGDGALLTITGKSGQSFSVPALVGGSLALLRNHVEAAKRSRVEFLQQQHFLIKAHQEILRLAEQDVVAEHNRLLPPTPEKENPAEKMENLDQERGGS